MYEIINYKSKFYNELNRLYIKHNNGMESTEPGYLHYNKKVKIKLFKADEKICGYIIFEKPHFNQEHDKLIIHQMFLEKDYSNLKNYKFLIDATNKFFIINRIKYAQVFINEKDGITEIIEMLDMKLEDRVYEMKLSLFNYIDISKSCLISFDFFSKGRDEHRRVEVQNEIFRGTKNHVDCSINDIIVEEKKRYFIEDGCIFIKTSDKTIGYSQIILEKGRKPYIVNFGIINDYRGQGLSRMLLSYTLNIIKEKGFDEVYITVDADNYKALNLYNSMGFVKVNTFSNFIYKFF